MGIRLYIAVSKIPLGSAAALTQGQRRTVCPPARMARTIVCRYRNIRFCSTAALTWDVGGTTRPSSWQVESRPYDKCMPGRCCSSGPRMRMRWCGPFWSVASRCHTLNGSCEEGREKPHHHCHYCSPVASEMVRRHGLQVLS